MMQLNRLRGISFIVYDVALLVVFGLLLHQMAAYYLESLQSATSIEDFYWKLTTLLPKLTYSAALFAFIVLLLWYFGPRRTKRVVLGTLLLGTVVYLFMLDLGTTLEHHGSYNAVMFAAMGAAFAVCIALPIWLFRQLLRPRRTGWVLLLLIALFAVIRAKVELGRFEIAAGIDRSRVESLCRLDYQNVFPWREILPSYYLTSWLRPATCPSNAPIARLESARKLNPTGDYPAYADVLIMNCQARSPDGNKTRGEYAILPDVRAFNQSEKETTQVLFDAVNEKFQMVPYRRPTVIVSGEGVVAKCGDTSTYLMRTLTSQRADKLQAAQKAASKPVTNVLFVFIDALSRNQLHRRMPMTVNFLRELRASNTSDVFEFYRHHGVATYTYPNLKALMFGTRLDAHLLPSFWERVFEREYVSSWFAGMCNNLYAEIKEAYGMFDVEYTSLMCLPEYHDPVFHTGMSKGPYSVWPRCLGSRPVHSYIFEQAERHFEAYKDVNKLAWVSLLEAHEGTSYVIGLVDQDLVRFLNKIDMHNTVLIIIGDHGPHMGFEYLYTYQGDMESKLPALVTAFPRHIVKQSPELFANLAENQYKVSSPWDLYKTMIDLKSVLAGEERISNEAKRGPSTNSCLWTAQSLFDSLQHNRTCDNSCVPYWTCLCNA